MLKYLIVDLLHKTKCSNFVLSNFHKSSVSTSSLGCFLNIRFNSRLTISTKINYQKRSVEKVELKLQKIPHIDTWQSKPLKKKAHIFPRNDSWHPAKLLAFSFAVCLKFIEASRKEEGWEWWKKKEMKMNGEENINLHGNFSKSRIRISPSRSKNFC